MMKDTNMKDGQLTLNLTPAIVPVKPTYHGSQRDGYPVATIGPVNLETAKNAMFGSMWDCWSEGDGTNFLVEQDGKFRAVHTSGTMDSIKTGDVIFLEADQTGRAMGPWNVKAKAPHTAAGVRSFKAVCGKSSVSFATFK